MADFKDEISVGLARALSRELVRAEPAFPKARFARGLAEALEPLALMERVDFLAERLERTLPDDFTEAAAVLHRALTSRTFTGWMTLPCCAYVSRAGIEHPDVALPLLAALTPRWSSELAIRPFIERYPSVSYGYLRRWARDPDEHVRRLVSEGTRPRLPWARRLRALIADPRPNVELLDMLVDDPSPYVRRSVANHLNDISKDHPALAVELARRWQDRGAGALWVVRHGLRWLIKRGDPDALELIGVRHGAPIDLSSFSVDRTSVPIGGSVTLVAVLEVAGDDAVEAEIDYRVHYVGPNGVRGPKVFKLTRRSLQPGRPVSISRRHPFHHVSIRRIHPGSHLIDLQVNGRVLGSLSVDVTP